MKRYCSVIKFLLCVHLLALVVMTSFRVIEYMELGHMVGVTNEASVLTAYVKGVWFDNVVACYVMSVPLVLTLVLFPWKKLHYKVTGGWTVVSRRGFSPLQLPPRLRLFHGADRRIPVQEAMNINHLPIVFLYS